MICYLSSLFLGLYIKVNHHFYKSVSIILKSFFNKVFFYLSCVKQHHLGFNFSHSNRINYLIGFMQIILFIFIISLVFLFQRANYSSLKLKPKNSDFLKRAKLIASSKLYNLYQFLIILNRPIVHKKHFSIS